MKCIFLYFSKSTKVYENTSDLAEVQVEIGTIMPDILCSTIYIHAVPLPETTTTTTTTNVEIVTTNNVILCSETMRGEM